VPAGAWLGKDVMTKKAPVKKSPSLPSGTEPSKKGPVGRFFALLGPGLVTGAADDDPSGIVTYSIAGAQLGTSLLWTALVTWPLMAACQLMCARIGMVSGVGLAGALRKKFPRWLLIPAALALFIANTINISADLSGMADVTHMLTGINGLYFVVLFGVGILVVTVQFPYAAIASILKWLAAVLFAYIITAFLAHPHWPAILKATFFPRWPTSHAQWTTLVAILGTTISPYLFFWQSSQEIEEEKVKGHRTEASRRGAPSAELNNRAIDVGIGTFFSNLVMYFIILTAALTLHNHGITQLNTSADAVKALRPLAGNFASILYSAGLIGVGFLAIPTLAGSTAYAFSETFDWRQGLDQKLLRARAFYGVLACSVIVGMALSFTSVKAMDALFLTAVINGILAPFLLVGILIVACDRVIMQNQPSSMVSRVVVAVTTLGMFGAAVALFVL
jgi:NRAMP (natural resistance-associated macrophage protein)-like metal ion transporter